MQTARHRGRRDLRRRGTALTLVLVLAASVVLGALGVVGDGVQQAVANTGTSPNGYISLTETPSKTTVAAGGESVTFTYAVKNLTNSRLRYEGIGDDNCAQLDYQSGLTAYQSDYYLAGGSTATWTCQQTVTETTTTNAWFTVGFYSGGRYYRETAAASATVTVANPAPASCGPNTLWYSAGYATATRKIGGIGTIDTKAATLSPTRAANTTMTDNGTTMAGSAALAADPAHPNLVYHIPRDQSGSSYGGLYVYDSVKQTSAQITAAASTPDTNRMGVSPDFSIWAVDLNGEVWRLTAGSATWQDLGRITLPGGLSWSRYQSGDLTFDGLGTMWLIGSNMETRTAFLYTVASADLTNGDGSMTASLVGDMGTGEFDGIAFTADGTLWGTSRDNSKGTGALHQINKDTGSTTLKASFSGEQTEDLGSCALPKPELKVTKEVSPAGAVKPGDKVTYTIRVHNLGTLSATGTTLQDSLPAGTTYVAGSAKLEATQISTASTFPYSTERPLNSPRGNTGIIAAGEAATISFQVHINSTTQTQVCNQGLVSFVGASTGGVKSDDPNQPGGTDATCSPILKPQIGIDTTADTAVTTANPQSVRYSYAVANPGTEDLKDVTVADDMCSPVVATLAEGAKANVGDLNRDSRLQPSETWQYTCTASLTGTVTNTAVSTGYGVTTGTKVIAQDAWTVTAASLTIDKRSSANGQPVKAGDTIEYTIDVKNTGTTDQTDVTLTDTLPAGVTYVPGSATKTYPYTATTAQTVTGSYQTSLTTGVSYDTSATQAFTVVDGKDVPAGAKLTGYTVTLNGASNYMWSPAFRRYYYGWQREVAVTAIRPGGGAWFAVDDGSKDADNNEFGTSAYGGWKTVTRTGTTSGAAAGRYTLNWRDILDNYAVTDQTVTNVDVSLNYTATTTASVRTIKTDAAAAPAALVTATSAITLKPGEMLTVKLKASVNAGAPATLTNTGSTTSKEEPTPHDDTVTDTVPKPAFGVQKAAAGGAAGGAGTAVQVNPDGTATATYQVTATNNGAAPGPHPPIIDTVTPPKGFAVTGVTATGGPTSTTGAVNPDGTATTTIPAATADLPVGVPLVYTVTVQLKAADLARVDWSAAGTCANQGAGTPGSGVFNLVTMSGDGDGVDNNDACVPVDQPTMSIAVQKQGLNCDVAAATCPLAGAQFALYSSDPATAGATRVDDAVTVTGDGSTFTVASLTPGAMYWLVETKSPQGHTLLATAIPFSVARTGGIKLGDSSSTGLVSVGGADGLMLTVKDPTRAPLPQSGGEGPLPFVAAGSLLMLIAAGSQLVISRQGRAAG